MRCGNHKGWRWEDLKRKWYLFSHPNNIVMWKKDEVFVVVVCVRMCNLRHLEESLETKSLSFTCELNKAE